LSEIDFFDIRKNVIEEIYMINIFSKKFSRKEKELAELIYKMDIRLVGDGMLTIDASKVSKSKKIKDARARAGRLIAS
jgi:hypothetical protein